MERTLDFLVIGAQKSGTTALFHMLAAHPDLYVPAGKDLFSHARARTAAACRNSCWITTAMRPSLGYGER